MLNKEQTAQLQELFPDNRESGETKQRQCQLVMIRMLKIFDYLSKKYEFNYWLEWGTLLGAVREQGFIPWDFDIDIGILRPDFEKFVREAAHELPNDIFLAMPETEPLYSILKDGKILNRLHDKYSCYVEWSLKNREIKAHTGLMIDLFIYDNISQSQLKTTLRNSFSWLIRRIIRKPDEWIPSLSYAFTEERLFPLKYLEFEGTLLPVPNDYDRYLRFYYGDYMQLPPIEKRVPEVGAADPFIPCDHKEILFWNEKSREEWLKLWQMKPERRPNKESG